MKSGLGGPVPRKELDEWAATGRIAVESQVRAENQTWIGVAEIYPNLYGGSSVGRAGVVVAEPAKLLVGMLRTVSGNEHTFTSVLMFDLTEVQAADSLRAAAEKNLSGFSSGLGWMGGSLPSWIAHTLATRGVEALVSMGMSSKGVQQVEAYSQACRRVRASGQFIPLNRIENIRVPIPALWQCLSRPPGFVLNGDPAIVLETDKRITCILWDKVEEYVVTESPK